MGLSKLTGYSTIILAGLRQMGLGDERIRSAARVGSALFSAIDRGTREFTEPQLMRLEDAVDLTVGQIAARVLEPNGGEFTEMSNGWGRVRRAAKRAIAGRHSHEGAATTSRKQRSKLIRPAAKRGVSAGRR